MALVSSQQVKGVTQTPLTFPRHRATFWDFSFHYEPDLTDTGGKVQTMKMAKPGPVALPASAHCHQLSDAAALGAEAVGWGNPASNPRLTPSSSESSRLGITAPSARDTLRASKRLNGILRSWSRGWRKEREEQEGERVVLAMARDLFVVLAVDEARSAAGAGCKYTG